MTTFLHKLKPGECVRLNSGGPVMIVRRCTNPEAIECVWCNQAGHICIEYFPRPCLIHLSTFDTPAPPQKRGRKRVAVE